MSQECSASTACATASPRLDTAVGVAEQRRRPRHASPPRRPAGRARRRSPTASRRPSTSKPTTGVPAAWASSATMPSPSNRDGMITTAARAYSRFNAVAIEAAEVLDASAALAPPRRAPPPRDCRRRRSRPRTPVPLRVSALEHRDRLEHSLLALQAAHEEHAAVLVLDAGHVDRDPPRWAAPRSATRERPAPAARSPWNATPGAPSQPAGRSAPRRRRAVRFTEPRACACR